MQCQQRSFLIHIRIYVIRIHTIYLRIKVSHSIFFPIYNAKEKESRVWVLAKKEEGQVDGTRQPHRHQTK